MECNERLEFIYYHIEYITTTIRFQRFNGNTQEMRSLKHESFIILSALSKYIWRQKYKNSNLNIQRII